MNKGQIHNAMSIARVYQKANTAADRAEYAVTNIFFDVPGNLVNAEDYKILRHAQRILSNLKVATNEMNAAIAGEKHFDENPD